MSSAIDLSEVASVRSVLSEHAALNGYLQKLVGQPFFAGEFSYGDELTVHFGKEVGYVLPRFGPQVKGEFVLGCRGSDWLLSTPSGEVLSNTLNRDEAESLLAAVPRGATVSVADACPWRRGDGEQTYSLLLKCGSAMTLVVVPDGVFEPDDISDWELFMPEDKLLQVGPGLRFSLGSSKDPA